MLRRKGGFPSSDGTNSGVTEEGGSSSASASSSSSTFSVVKSWFRGNHCRRGWIVFVLLIGFLLTMIVMDTISQYRRDLEFSLEQRHVQHASQLSKSFEERLTTMQHLKDRMESDFSEERKRWEQKKSQIEQEYQIRLSNVEQKSESEHREYQNEMNNLRSQWHQTNQTLMEILHQHDNDRQKLQRMMAYRTKLQSAIQHLSRLRVLERWGPGPHRVQIEIAFPLGDDNDEEEVDNSHGINGTMNNHTHNTTIVIELAPLSLMPHSIDWFLSQVSLGLWDGASFHRNADHVLQAGAVRNSLTPPHVTISDARFRKAGYESVLFQEYTPSYPHKPFTVGYAGRPGGPDFYISVLDNTENHGPGGQDLEADPCFGTVVEGFDVIRRMQKRKRVNDDFQAFVHSIGIAQITILKPPLGNNTNSTA